jgi:hypothetical protein
MLVWFCHFSSTLRYSLIASTTNSVTVLFLSNARCLYQSIKSGGILRVVFGMFSMLKMLLPLVSSFSRRCSFSGIVVFLVNPDVLVISTIYMSAWIYFFMSSNMLK